MRGLTLKGNCLLIEKPTQFTAVRAAGIKLFVTALVRVKYDIAVAS